MSERNAHESGIEVERKTVEEVARQLRCSVQDVGELVRKGLIRPLGSPAPQNAVKFFSRREITELCQTREFLDKVTRAIYRYHTARNKKHKNRSHSKNLENGHTLN
jgi:hypothetical protein